MNISPFGQKDELQFLTWSQLLFTLHPTSGSEKKLLETSALHRYQLKFNCKACVTGAFIFFRKITGVFAEHLLRILFLKAPILVGTNKPVLFGGFHTLRQHTDCSGSPMEPNSHGSHNKTQAPPHPNCGRPLGLCLSPSAHISLHVPKRSMGERVAAVGGGVAGPDRYTDHMCRQTTKR